MSKRMPFFWMQRRALTAILGVLAVVSVVTAIFQVPAAWQTPLVLAALLAVIAMLDPVEEIRTNVRYVEEIRTDVRYLRNVKESAPSRTFATSQEFFNDLSRAEEHAGSTLDLTHIRDDPPLAFGTEATQYVETVTAWLQADERHSARRIVSVQSVEMKNWAKHLAEIQKQIPRYRVRVVDWSISAPALNLAIVDGKAVFLALTGEEVERTKGFAIEDETTAAYFSQYYARLWTAGVDVEEFLEKQEG